MHDAATVMERLDLLAACSTEPGGITRLFLTPAHAQAIALVQGWMAAAGLAVHVDASGTLVGRREGPQAGSPLLLLGSHIDTVRGAGRYDGCLGVVAAIALAEKLATSPLPYALEIRAFGDEEGVRFPVTLTGAHATAGRFDPAWLDVQDRDGISLRAALVAMGLDPAALLSGACTARHAFAYLELHIEQGPVLEAADAALGIVTAINGAVRLEVTVTGQAGHAGTVPMAQRRDALVAASAMVLAVRRMAIDRHVVATVGQFAVAPGATNVIPGRCVFTIDLRAPQDGLRRLAEQALDYALHEAARDHGVALSIRKTHEAAAVACDMRLQAALAQAVTGTGRTPLHLPSGAGHDAMAVAPLCPVGMLFVRCKGGISHHPDESVRLEDVAAALEVMEGTLRQLDPATFAR